jgi:hypothetical protein
MQCHQFEITGSGTAFPDPSYLVAFPGAYSPTESGLLLNIYYPAVTSYDIPGPSVWTGTDSNDASDEGQHSDVASMLINDTALSGVSTTRQAVGSASGGQPTGQGLPGPTTTGFYHSVDPDDFANSSDASRLLVSSTLSALVLLSMFL